MLSVCSCPPFECLCHVPGGRYNLEPQANMCSPEPVYNNAPYQDNKPPYVDINELQVYPSPQWKDSYAEYINYGSGQKPNCEVAGQGVALVVQQRVAGAAGGYSANHSFTNSSRTANKVSVHHSQPEYNNNCMFSNCSSMPVNSSHNSMPLQQSHQQPSPPGSNFHGHSNLNDSLNSSSTGQLSPGSVSVDGHSLYSSTDARGPFYDDFEIHPDNIFSLDQPINKERYNCEQREPGSFDLAFLPSITSFLGEEEERPIKIQREKTINANYPEKSAGHSGCYIQPSRDEKPVDVAPPAMVHGKPTSGRGLSPCRGPSTPESLIELQPVGPGKGHDSQALVSSLASQGDSRSAFHPYNDRVKDAFNSPNCYETISNKAHTYVDSFDSFSYYNGEIQGNNNYSSMPLAPYHNLYNSRTQSQSFNIGLTLTTYK